MTIDYKSSSTATAPLAGVQPGRLFAASCISLISTAITFAVIGDIMGTLKEQFILTNQRVGWIGGAATWGFTLSIFVLGPLCDALGMRLLMRFAFLCHTAGVVLMIAATKFAGDSAFWMLFFGALIISLGNGTVEAACNPLVATIYPDRKTQKLNQFHMWFPGGIVIGGLIAFLISQFNPGLWQIKLAVILVPTVVYGILFTGQAFPQTERVQSGITFGGMFKETFARPLFIILLACMCITASLELGPNRWVPSVLQAGGIAGILVLCYINGLMAILRYFAGPVVHKLSNTGILVLSALLAGLGLLGLSYSTTTAMALLTATVFAVGVCYFWPTMLGTVSERVPKGGSLALALMGGVGMLAVGVVTTPQMGTVADDVVYKELVGQREVTVGTLKEVVKTYPTLVATAKNDVAKAEANDAIADAQHVLEWYAVKKELPKAVSKDEANAALKAQRKGGLDTAGALRSASRVAPADPKVAEYLKLRDEVAAKKKPETALADPQYKDAALVADAAAVGKSAKATVDKFDNHGGLTSFRYVAPFAAILVLVFGIIYLGDLRKGGYKPESIHA